MTGAAVLAQVVEPGLTTIQDLGRWGHQSVGVPVAGALHRSRYRVLAMLMGADDPLIDPPGPPALELLAGKLKLDLDADVRFAVVGPAAVTIEGRTMPSDTVLDGHRGARITVQGTREGPIYVAIAGWHAHRVLGSASSDTFSGLGAKPLAAGDLLGGSSAQSNATTGNFSRALTHRHGPVRIIPGPMWSSIRDRTWQVDAHARSGTRLSGDAVSSISQRADGVSNPVVRGVVQLPPSGNPVILGPDGALTGGYAVAGTVITADLDRVFEIPTGGSVEFIDVTPEQAYTAWVDSERLLATCIVRTMA